MDDVPEISSELDVTTSEEPSSEVPVESEEPSEAPVQSEEPSEAPVESYKYDDWILLGLSTIDEDNQGNGRDIDGIAKYIKEKQEVADNFKEELIEEVEKLVAAGHIEKVGDRYKISHGYFESDEGPSSSSEANRSKELTQTSSSQATGSKELTQTSSEESLPPKDRPSPSLSDQQDQKRRKTQ